uniref:AMP-dependent synthetase/ligase domain-containing protein n=1 Tax=Panagrolaimus superbus TaxID=310955 RepID=A0A914XY41_9BILA
MGGAIGRRESVIYGPPISSPIGSPHLLSRRPSGNNCHSVPASPMGQRKSTASISTAAAPAPASAVTHRSPPPRSVARGGVRQAMLRSKSQSRTALKQEESIYDVIPNQKQLKDLATTEIVPKRKSINGKKSTSSTPTPQRKQLLQQQMMSQSTTNISKQQQSRPRLPISLDSSIILEVFDPEINDRRRAAIEKASFTASRDRIGFDLVQQELRAFALIKGLYLGRFRRIQIQNLLGIEQWHSNLLMKKHQMTNLQRPQRKPLQEYYNDDDAQLEALTKLIDPNAPRPTGQMITPARGDFPVAMTAPNGIRSTASAKSFEAVLERHSQVQPKVNCSTVIDHTGKLSTSLTYGKLYTRAIKIAHMLLTKTITVQIPNSGKEKRPLCLPGDRVALVYPNTEPIAFLTAFYGCILAGMVPVPVEVPLTRRDAGIQQFGFLLGSCGVRVALTSESCLKGLPKFGSQPSSTITSANSNSGIINSGTYHHSTNGSTGSGGSASTSHLPISTTPHGPNDVADFKGWPRLQWVVTEHLSKPSKDWKPPSAVANGENAYIEYVTDREGSVKGVCVTREAMLSHCRAIVAAMGYKENEVMITVLDFKRDIGLWHGILAAIYAGMRVIFVPYSVMKVNPTSWMFHASKLQATAALVKSRDLHWSVMATPRDSSTGHLLSQNNAAAPLQLSSLRCVVVADGANPWSLSPCDQFSATFHSRGLRPDAICPVAGSPETGSLCIRRPSETGGGNSGRGTLSMSALSFNVVRVDQENSLTSLTVQDSGQIVPGGLAVVIRPTGSPKLCKTDEIGEICLHAPSTASRYYGLKGITTQNFQVQPLSSDDKPLGPANYVRSGLIGFMTPEGLAFVIGNKSSMMSISGRQHSADDIIATVLAVDSMKFIYRGRIAVFSVRVLRDERVCVIAEQKADVAEEDAFNWMLRVIQAVDSIHQLSLYCIALVPANQLPKTPLGGLHVSETRQRFLDGSLHPSTLLMCPQSSVLNLPEPREPRHNDVGAAFMMVGNLIQGARIASASGRELIISPDEQIYFIDILRQRVQQTPDHILFTLINSKGVEIDTLSCAQLLKKAERIGALLLDKGHLNAGDHVALIFPPGLELITAFYGCLAAGLVPVCIRPPAATNLAATLVTVRMVVDVSKSVALLSTSTIIKLLKCKEASHRVNAKAWPTILDVEDMPSSSVARRRNVIDQIQRKPSDICYLDFAVSTTGQLAGIVITALSAATQAKSLKTSCELYPSRHVVLSLDPYSGLGFSLWTLSSVYSGHHSILIPPSEVETNPSLWLSIVSQHKVRDTFCSYSVMENCVRELAAQVPTLKEKGVNLSCLRTCVAVAEERPRVSLCNAFSKLFSPLGLNPRVVSTSFGGRVNPAICMQGAASPDPSIVYVDAWALRNDRITLVEKVENYYLV